MKALHMVAWILVIIGGLNWGLHAFGYNLVDMIFGAGSALSKVVYVLVALSAVYELVTHKQTCKMCAGEMSSKPMM
ncbi:MAG: DUF378 domain-containing protein [Candidatus Doudnabacteria bacterium]|nr:DUF378 domain-containing protein [Candidatus Doudnabacteria bacterium]